MVKCKMKTIKYAFVFVFCAFMVFSSTSASAMTQFSQHSDVPADSYTYWKTDSGFKAVYTKPLFDKAKVMDAKTIGVEDFTELIDVSVGDDGYVYILDSSSRVVILDSNYELYREYKTVGDKEFKGAKGIFAHDDKVYISDTENKRVLVADKNGNYCGELLRPESTVIPSDFSYMPIKTIVDKKGYKYILCDGSYYGALLLSPENNFISFYGSNTVKTGVVQVLEDLWNRLTMTDEKYERQARKFPYQFTDISIDSNGFIYTSTGKTEGSEWLQKGVIRNLAPNGNDIIDSGEVVFGEKQVPLTFGRGYYVKAQNMGGITVDDDDFFYTFDTTYNKVYMYDNKCNLICVIGGGYESGQQKGTFKRITAIDNSGDDLIVLDGTKNTVSLYKCNDYGKSFKMLQSKTLKGEYSEAKSGWQSIMQSDVNNQFAYKGLAGAAYAEGDYKLALSLSKQAYDKEIYAQAYEQLRKEWLHQNIKWVILVVAVAIAVIIIFNKKFKTKIAVKNDKAKWMFKSVFHPAESFAAIKQKNLSSVKLGMILLLLYYLSDATQNLFGNFMFVSEDSGSFNSVLLLFRTVGIVLLWCVSNWAVCTLLGGIGKIREIFTVVCYSLIPVIVANFGFTILTYIFIPSEISFITIIMAATKIYALIMLIIGTIIIHDFSFGRFWGTTLLTVFAMAVVLFLVVLIIVLVQQFIAFGATVYNEILFR